MMATIGLQEGLWNVGAHVLEYTHNVMMWVYLCLQGSLRCLQTSLCPLPWRPWGFDKKRSSHSLIMPMLEFTKLLYNKNRLYLIFHVNCSILTRPYDYYHIEPYNHAFCQVTIYFVISSFFTDTNFFLLCQLNSYSFLSSSFKEMVNICVRH